MFYGPFGRRIIIIKYIIIKERKSDYPNPLVLVKGDLVMIGKDSSGFQWENWIECITENNSGWVPKQIVSKTKENMGLIIEDYSAQELDVFVNDIFIYEKEINGWLWGYIENNPEKKGWIPKENGLINTPIK